MANIKSDKKTILTSKKRNASNSSFKSSLKTELKLLKLRLLRKMVLRLETAYMKLDKACAKGIVHKNYVANQKSRLAKVVNAIA